MTETTVILRGLPLPPSQNQAYRNVSGGPRGRAKTRDYRLFEMQMADWCARHENDLARARRLCARLDRHNVFHVEYCFYFKHEDIFMQNDGKPPKARPWERPRRKGEPKRNDTSNRIKVLDDCLAKVLGIDDSWFWSGSFTKQALEHPVFPAGVDVTLTLRSPIVKIDMKIWKGIDPGLC